MLMIVSNTENSRLGTSSEMYRKFTESANTTPFMSKNKQGYTFGSRTGNLMSCLGGKTRISRKLEEDEAETGARKSDTVYKKGLFSSH